MRMRLLLLLMGFSLVPALSFTSTASDTQPRAEQQAHTFAGTWVRKVDGRPFIILRLTSSGTHVTGTLSRPTRFSEVSGEHVTVTDPHVIKLAVQRSAVVEGKLDFSTQDPADAKTSDQHAMIVWDQHHASLDYFNDPMTPRWTLVRVDDNPGLSVATKWPEQTKAPTHYSPEITALQQQLAALIKEDQAADTPPYTSFRAVCVKNYPIVLRIFRKYGFLKESVVGRDAASAFLYLSVHQSDLHPGFAEAVLAAMKAALNRNEASPSEYALFYDALARSEKRPQHWGTATVCKQGKRTLYPVDDPGGFERRRDEAQLPPLAPYIRGLPPCAP